MSSTALLSHEQIEDLLLNVIGVTKMNQWKEDKIQFCCPVHHENRPSCGINADFSPNTGEHYQVFHCFSCGESGSLAWLLYKSLPHKFKSVKQASEFLEQRYGISFINFTFDRKTKTIRLYQDEVKIKNSSKSLVEIAPYKSGKETYKYFFNRGFNAEDMKEYLIGRDLENDTVTIPVFNADKSLAGVIGRYIDPNRPHNMRYKIYEFKKGKTLFPIDKVEVVDDTVILVEGIFDAMLLRKWGYFNVLAIMGNQLSREQADLIDEIGAYKIICLLDNDKGGKDGIALMKKRFGRKRFIYYVPSYYPEEGKDPNEWGEIETNKVINSAELRNISIPLL